MFRIILVHTALGFAFPFVDLLWLFSAKSINYRSFMQTNLKVGKESMIFVYGNGCLHAISTIDGEVIWKKDLTTEGIEVQKLIHPLGSDVIHAIGFGDMSRIDASVIDAKNGELLKHNSAAFPGGFSGEISSVSSDTFVASDSTRSILVLINVRDGEISFQQTNISDLLQDSSGTAVVLPSKLTGTFAIRIDNGLIIFIKVTDEGKLVLADKIDHRATFSDALLFSEGQQAVAIIQHEGSKFQLTVKDGYDWNNDLLTESINLDHSRGLVHKVFINNYIRTDRSHGFRVLIVMEDHSLLLVQQGEIVWSREDGLASVVDTTTSELPVEKHGVSVANVEQNLFEWLKVQSFQKAFQKLVYH